MPWFDGLARILVKVEEIGVWLDGLLDAYFATFPKVGGAGTPVGVFFRWYIVCGRLLA